MLISATHTHSAPVTVHCLCSEADPVVPAVNPDYLRQVEDGLVVAAVEAWQRRRPAELAIVEADATGIGTCRHDPAGPSLLSVPVLTARDYDSGEFLALLLVCAMHPTVLHEDSTLYSGDFPAYARRYLQEHVAGAHCPVIYHTGAAGDQSPRHVTRANTPAEAERLGKLLGAAVQRALRGADYSSDLHLACATRWVDLPARRFPSIEQAGQRLDAARLKLEQLRAAGAPAATVRTAECDWFGAEESFYLSQAAADGRIEQTLGACLPAEVPVLEVGRWRFVAWPGEFFVAFALRIRQLFPKTAIITLANGELQGYVVTAEAVERQWYEASNALLQSPDAGDAIVAATLPMLREMEDAYAGR
jgi:hypothetical protein